MMIQVGNWLYQYRNGLFPVVYALLLFKSQTLLPEYRLAAALGFLVALTGQLLRAITIGLEYIIRGGRNRQVFAEKLVTGGIFAHCRNPLYLGNFLILLGVGLASNSLLFMAVAIPFFAFAYWAIIAAEENYLRDKFGQEFEHYCAKVNRFLPNVSGLRQTLQAMRFNWRRLIFAEYGSTFLWLVAIILVVLKNVWLGGEYESSRVLVTSLWAALALVTLAYALARYAKKTGNKRAQEPTEP